MVNLFKFHQKQDLKSYSLSEYIGKSVSRLHKLKKDLSKFISDRIFEDDKEIIVPPPKHHKPTLVFDPYSFLIKDDFSIFNFGIFTQKRCFTEEFLFDLAGSFELVSVSDRYPFVTTDIISKIDPFNIISYRVSVHDKTNFGLKNINRSPNRLLVISTEYNEFDKSLNDNMLKLPKWKGKKDNTLLYILHFLNSCKYSNIKDFRSLLSTYRDKDFVNTFKCKQQSLFRQRNMLSFSNYGKELDELNRFKVQNYEKAKKNLKAKEKVTVKCVLSKSFNFVKDFLL